MLTQGEVESEIMRLSARLEEATDAYWKAAESEAQAEVDYKSKAAKLSIAASNQGIKSAANVIYLRCEAEWKDQRMKKATSDAIKQSMLSLRAQLSALQTLARVIGDQT